MNELLVVLILVLLPGIIATLLIEHFLDYVPTPRWDMFRYGMYALVLGVLSYLLEQVFHSTELKVWDFFLRPTPSNVDLFEILWAIGIAVVLGFTVAAVANHKLLVKIANTLNVTRKYGDESLFSHYLNSSKIAYVYVRDMERNLTYSGYLGAFSDNDKVQELVLENVVVYRSEDALELYSLPSVYICRSSGSLVIEQIANSD
ncbi:MAG: DUF6338 family protein [Methylophilaceae bacterium]|nr:DUF6338 family protein [Methylophilaceae bacterium]